MKRIAYVGLSTPLFYDYKHPAATAPGDLISSPNPILECPSGLLLLFDEIWFLTRSLCPQNMRALTYVKFVDEQFGGVLDDLLPRGDWESEISANPVLSARYEASRTAFFSRYQENVAKTGVWWEAAPDNHSHGIKIGNQVFTGNSASMFSALVDLQIATRLKMHNAEWITNSITQGWLSSGGEAWAPLRLTQHLMVDRIPNTQTPHGPWGAHFEEIRANPHLCDFRAWAAHQQFGSEKEIFDFKKQVDAAIKWSMKEIFLKQFDRKKLAFGAGLSLVGEALGALVPGGGLMVSGAEQLSSYLQQGQRRWQAFLVSTSPG